MVNNSCYTYFKIVGNFDPNQITKILKLTPNEQWSIGDIRGNGKGTYDFACWTYGRCDNYDIYVDNMMMKTIHDLIGKKKLLKEIKKRFDVKFYLEIVPEVWVDESTPCLAPNLEIMKFCCDTKTEIDIDLYVYSK